MGGYGNWKDYGSEWLSVLVSQSIRLPHIPILSCRLVIAIGRKLASEQASSWTHRLSVEAGRPRQRQLTSRLVGGHCSGQLASWQVGKCDEFSCYGESVSAARAARNGWPMQIILVRCSDLQ